MIKREKKLVPGQNLRYSGKGFPGFKKEQPYMVFVDYKGVHQLVVTYNDMEVVVNKYHTEPI
ncbi:hypothetical protein [Desertivirga arenae]|uniref:hypothetical protein n=1 Tax=Desertivirga arenae TaxID=2810309 RepID=UPI001A97163E|nr:hypothetical protein [Pedobacter sp. SYSU D00823]